MAKSYSSKEIIRRLVDDGWRLDRVEGSHHQFRHPARPGRRVTLPHPVKDIPPGTLRSIFRQAEWDWKRR
jgi:predicted RNA binding protein YcfA (HicA-like mRNA interferase family)